MSIMNRLFLLTDEPRTKPPPAATAATATGDRFALDRFALDRFVLDRFVLDCLANPARTARFMELATCRGYP